MLKPISNILFATNLSKNCAEAFDVVASMAVRYRATIILLHVTEKMPDSIEGRLKGMFGESKWQEISQSHATSARQILIGKRSSSKLIQTALEQFCADSGIDHTECGYVSREVVIRDGEVVHEIIEQATSYNCDLIIMAARQGFLSKHTSIGPTIKSVLRNSRVPVLIVPPVIKE